MGNYFVLSQLAQVASFLFMAKVARWTLKTFLSNEFNAEVPASEVNAQTTLAICKFCQIIANKETLCFEDSRVAVFEDIRPQAQKHFLVLPKTHIKDVTQVTAKHADLI